MTAAQHTLYIVATPIGNRDDLSLRAIALLQSVDRIYAEDTRHSLPLLQHHAIHTRVWSLHEHNESARVESVLLHLEAGGSAALISDAGTPLISDPGYRLVRACLQRGVRVSPIPGPCALTAALSISGLPTDRFLFVGFPPARAAARRQWLASLTAMPHTLVIYESPHRILATQSAIVDLFGGEREMTLARELTKRFETVMHGRAADVLEMLTQDVNQQRGEFVLMVAGRVRRDSEALAIGETGNPVADVAGDDAGKVDGGVAANVAADVAADAATDAVADAVRVAELERVLTVLMKQLPPSAAARSAAELVGVTRRTAYECALKMQGHRAD